MHHELIVPALLALLAAVVTSGATARLLRSLVPLPVVQIAVGLAIGTTELRLRINPDMFLLAILPPLLFVDAWRMPGDALRRDARTVGELALGLVFVTVVGMGLVIHWLLPTMPLALCFALGAVLSPTDAVAVGSIARRDPLPHRLRHILEEEALLNDATALVCLRFATAAWLTGTFEAGAALATFLWLALVGLAVGAAMAWTVGIASVRIARRYGEDAGAHILVTLLLPFAAYLLAEAIHASGILAAVAAGLVMPRVDRLARRPALIRLQRRASWDTIGFALNGAAFVLLGEQLPLIAKLAEPAARFIDADGLGELALLILAVTLALLMLRGCWVWLSLRVDIARRPDQHRFAAPPLPLVGAATLAGVRGTVTLVAVLTLPRNLPDPAQIAARDIAVIVATGVVLLSLIIAGAGLPPLLRKLAASDDCGGDRVAGRLAVTARAQPQVDALCDVAPEQIAASIRAMMRNENASARSNLLLAIVQAKREAVYALRTEGALSATVANAILLDLDTAEAFHSLDTPTRPGPGS